MLFNEVENILSLSTIILERAEDSYIHNVNMENLFKILNSGKLIGSPQNDGATPKLDKKGKKTEEGYIPSKPELCLSRSDYCPQKTGILPTYGLKYGDLIKIQLKMPAITGGKLRIKKPYPVSFGNYSRNRMILTDLEDLRKAARKEESKEAIDNLIKRVKQRTNYQTTKEHKGNWPIGKEYRDLLKYVIDKETVYITNEKGEEEPHPEASTAARFIEKNNLKKAWYDTGEDTGESRLELSGGKSIPVSSKYMTINIPEKLMNDPNLKKYMNLYKDDPGLFKTYKDDSKAARKRVYAKKLFDGEIQV